jgi:hypothetical protein
MILSFCDKPTVDCHGSIIYLSLINRLMPYVIALLTQVEQYKYLSYKLDAVGFRLVFKYFDFASLFNTRNLNRICLKINQCEFQCFRII